MHLAGDGASLAGLLRPGGRIASTLGLSKDDVEDKGVTDVTVHPVMADPSARTLEALAVQVISGALQVPVTGTYPLAQAPEAFTAFGAGALGKLAVTLS